MNTFVGFAVVTLVGYLCWSDLTALDFVKGLIGLCVLFVFFALALGISDAILRIFFHDVD